MGRLHTDAWRWAYDGLFDPSLLARRNAARSTAMWQRVLAEGTSVVLVAERDGFLVRPPVATASLCPSLCTGTRNSLACAQARTHRSAQGCRRRRNSSKQTTAAAF